MTDGGAGGSWGRVVTVCAARPLGLKERGFLMLAGLFLDNSLALWLWILGFWLFSLGCLGFHLVFACLGFGVGFWGQSRQTLCLAWRAWMALFSRSVCCLHEHPHHLSFFSLIFLFLSLYF